MLYLNFDICIYDSDRYIYSLKLTANEALSTLHHISCSMLWLFLFIQITVDSFPNSVESSRYDV